MAITDATKAIIMSHKQVLKSRRQALRDDRTQHQAAIASINTMIDDLTAKIAALDTDIPEPVVVPYP